MTDTTVSDAVAVPQDPGTGVPKGSADYSSAAYFGLLARQADGEYVDNGLDFNNVGSNETDVGAGHAYIEADQNTVSVQSGSQDTYGTDLPTGSTMTYLVILPSEVTNLSLASGSVNDVYLYIDPASNDSVTLRYGSAVSDPETDATPKPAIKLGTVDTNNNSTSRANDEQVLGGGAGGSVDINGNDLVDSGTTVWDTSAGEIPDGAMGSISNSTLANSSVTVTAGNGLTTGGTASLGGSVTLDIASGGVQTTELDLSISPTWTGTHTFDSEFVGQEIAKPASPSAGYNKLYFKSDDKLYKLDDAGNEKQIEFDVSVIKDGGAKEIDAQEFAGGDGTSGQVLTTDGSAASWSTSSSASVSEDGTQALSSPDDLNFIEGISVTDDGDNTVSIDANESNRAHHYVLGISHN